jgi:hypothetical protein
MVVPILTSIPSRTHDVMAHAPGLELDGAVHERPIGNAGRLVLQHSLEMNSGWRTVRVVLHSSLVRMASNFADSSQDAIGFSPGHPQIMDETSRAA